MRKSTKYVVLPITIVIFGGFIFAAYRVWQNQRENAILSCLSSIANEVDKSVKQKQFEVNNQPRELTQAEVEKLLNQINAYDCGQSQISSEKIHIAIGDVNKTSLFKIKVWTNGIDGIAGTDDDLVIPYGEKVQLK